jgi:hypothetical protein
MSKSGDNSRISNQRTPSANGADQLQDCNAAEFEGHVISLGETRERFREWLCSITFLGLGGFFESLFKHTVTVVDANAPIEKRLPSLVNEAREGKSQPLTDALSWLESDALNTLLTTTENGVLSSFVKTAQEGNPEYLADVLFRLEPNALKDLFIDEKMGS